MIGVLAKPMLASLCGVHDFAHQLAALSATAENPLLGSDHLHDASSLEREHGDGSHRWLHEDDVLSAYADLVEIIEVPALAYISAMPAAPVLRVIPQRHLDGPFRPPIA